MDTRQNKLNLRLWKCFEKNDFKGAGIAIDNGADIEYIRQEDDCKRTLLHCAAQNGDIAWVDFLLDRGADTESRNIDGETPFFTAMMNMQTETARFLADRDAEVCTKDALGLTPIQMLIGQPVPPSLVRDYILMGCIPLKPSKKENTDVPEYKKLEEALDGAKMEFGRVIATFSSEDGKPDIATIAQNIMERRPSEGRQFFKMLLFELFAPETVLAESYIGQQPDFWTHDGFHVDHPCYMLAQEYSLDFALKDKKKYVFEKTVDKIFTGWMAKAVKSAEKECRETEQSVPSL